MSTPKASLYEILGIDRDANAIDIGLAYERRRDEIAKRVPPDDSETALVQQAYEVLSNPQQRASYDASLVTAAEKAQAASQPTDLVLEPEPAPRSRPPIWAGALAGLVVIAAALYFTFHVPAPSAPAKEPPPEAPKPVVQPPPPQKLPPATILAGAMSSVGTLLGYDMSGQARPVGLAAAIGRGVFITTCHGIAAGSALVVRIGTESHSASLAVADEALDLCKLVVPDLRGNGLVLARDEPKAGDTIYVLGASAKGDVALTEGRVKQLRPVPGGKVIEVSIPIATNGSGGAAFDAYGGLVGIATTPHAFGTGLDIVLPASWFEQLRTRTRG